MNSAKVPGGRILGATLVMYRAAFIRVSFRLPRRVSIKFLDYSKGP